MSDPIVIEFEEIPPALIGRRGMVGMAYHTRKEHTERWVASVRLAVEGLLKNPIHRCAIVYEVQTPEHMWWDQMVSSFHLIGQGLIKAGIISDVGSGVVINFIPISQYSQVTHCRVTVVPLEKDQTLSAELLQVALPSSCTSTGMPVASGS